MFDLKYGNSCHMPFMLTIGGHDSSLEVEVRICVACDLLVAFCADNLLDLLVYEVVEGVDVLLDQAAHLQSVSRFISTVNSSVSSCSAHVTASVTA